jgi:hypothetical protein
MGSKCSITCQDVNSNNGFHPNQGFTTGWRTQFPIRQPPTRWYGGRTSTEVNLLSRILFGISLTEPKAKSRKMSPTNPVQEEEKAEAEVEAEPRSKKEDENLRKASPKDIRDTHLLPCSAAILDDLHDRMGDPGVPTISYLIGTQKFDQAL